MRLVSALLLPALAAALTGCSGTSRVVVSRADTAAVAAADAALQGRRATVYLVRPGDPARGRIAFVRTDSVAWTDDEALWTVPTAGVYGILSEDRWRAVRRGALIGAGVGAGVAVAVAAMPTDGDFDAEITRVLLVVAAVPYGVFYGAIGGALTNDRIEVVFEDRPLGPSE